MIAAAALPAMRDEGWRRGMALGIVADLPIQNTPANVIGYDDAGMRALRKINLLVASADVRRDQEARAKADDTETTGLLSAQPTEVLE